MSRRINQFEDNEKEEMIEGYDGINGRNEANLDTVDYFQKLIRNYPMFSEQEFIEKGVLLTNARISLNLIEEKLGTPGPDMDDMEINNALEQREKCLMELEEIEYLFVFHNIRLVIKLASQMRRRGSLDFADLVQEGLFGLKRAAEKFEPDRGVKFATYAYWWIKQAMLLEVANAGFSIRLPSHANEKILHIVRSVRLMELKGESGADKLAGVMEMKVDEVEKWRAVKSLQNLASLDSTVRVGDEEVPLSGAVSDPLQSNAEELYIRKDLKNQVDKLIQELTPRDRLIIERRFSDGATLEEVGDELKVTKERIRQILEKVLGILQEKAVKMGMV